MATDDKAQGKRGRVFRRVLRDSTTGQLTMRGHAPMVMVSAQRDVALSIEPSLHDDLDSLIEQLREIESREYLMAISAEPAAACESLKINYGKLKPATVAKLAEGFVKDRERAKDKDFELVKVLIRGLITLVVGLLVGYIIGSS